MIKVVLGCLEGPGCKISKFILKACGQSGCPQIACIRTDFILFFLGGGNLYSYSIHHKTSCSRITESLGTLIAGEATEISGKATGGR